MNLKFAILNVQVEDFPDIILGEFRNELVLAIFGDEWDVVRLTSEEFDDLADLLFHFLDF